MTMTTTNLATDFRSAEGLEHAWRAVKARSEAWSRQSMERRERAMKELVSAGLPNTRQEEWKYTSIRPLLERGFDLGALGEAQKYGGKTDLVALVKERLVSGAIPIVFVDGRWNSNWPGTEELPANLVRSLAVVEATEDSSWWDQWHLEFDPGRVFAGINIAMSQDGVHLAIGKRQTLATPIHIIHLSTRSKLNSVLINRVLVSAAEASKVRIFEEYINLNADSQEHAEWFNCLTQLRVGSNADVGYYRFVDSAGAFHTGVQTTVLDKASRFETFSLVTGARFARVNIDVKHTAPDSECLLDGLYLVGGNDLVDHHTAVDHAVGHSITRQLYKGILSGKSRGVFNGKIFIRKDAQGTQAYQTAKNLLLSSDAEVDAKPQLEIEADDVKASHGAAIGSIDPAELFYLQSRCIGRAEAMAMLCRGFADDVVMRVSDELARKAIGTRVAAWFKHLALSEPKPEPKSGVERK